jgi:hypothetical protein
MCSVCIFDLASGSGVCGKRDGVVVDGDAVVDVDEMGRVEAADAECAEDAGEQG